MGRSNTANPPNNSNNSSKVVGQYRVHVNENLIAGLPVRAGVSGAGEYLVRVPPGAEAGDSFVFTVTEHDNAQIQSTLLLLQQQSNNNTNNNEAGAAAQQQQQQQQHVIESAVLEKKKSWKEKITSIWPQFRYDLETQVLLDLRRTLFLSLVFSLALCSGFIVGSLFVTSDSWNNNNVVAASAARSQHDALAAAAAASAASAGNEPASL